jgi:hypothetical protein
MARPAAFGPLLPIKTLSGQLWIGSGFGNDHWGRGGSGAGAGAGGELGCSDVPGWEDGSWTSAKKSASDGKTTAKEGQGPPCSVKIATRLSVPSNGIGTARCKSPESDDQAPTSRVWCELQAFQAVASNSAMGEGEANLPM